MSPRCKLSDKTVVPILIIIICLGYLEWPSHRDHHLITSSDQLADCDGHLIIPTEDLYLYLYKTKPHKQNIGDCPLRHFSDL